MAPSPNRRETFGLAAGAVALGAGNAAADDAHPESKGPSFTLLLVNDIYLMGEVEGRGGFARLNAVVKAERARGVPLLYCHAGDCLSPSLMSGLDHGAHIIALHNIAPPDVFVPGNHEFDFGPQVFAERVREARFPWFAANLRDGRGVPLQGLKDRSLVTLNGVKVGIIGIALAATPEKSQSGDLRFGPEIETLANEAKALRGEGADLIVGVAHVARPTDDAIVAGRIVDILLSGHDHDLMVHYDGNTLLVESSHDAHYVTAIDVRVRITGEGEARRVTWRPSFRIHDTSNVTPDPETLTEVNRLEAALSRQLDVPVGVTTGPLDSRIASVRAREASFGDLVADAVRVRTGVEIGLMNGGGIRGNRLYPAGSTLTRRDILTELPFGNTTVVVEITGKTLHAVLENGYLDLGRPAGRFLQVSGLLVALDPGKPPGMRVVSVAVGGVPLDEGRLYRIAANNFMLEGGNSYGMLREGRVLVGTTDGQLLANTVIDYVGQRSPLPPDVGGRLTLIQ